MPASSFKANPIPLSELLTNAERGKLRLPDFQRSWVWDEDRIISLIASISRGFPVGALMTLEVRHNSNVQFKPRLVEGVDPATAQSEPDELLLDGQQRITSLYQSCKRQEVVVTITPKRKVVRRFFYMDIRKALDPSFSREEAILAMPEDRILKTDFDRVSLLDLSNPELEYKQLMFPLNRTFGWNRWKDGFDDYWYEQPERKEMRDLIYRFHDEVLENFNKYQIPVISLAHSTSLEAVCLVFEKVNTGGKPLDAFELLTAMYAAQGHNLRDDWFGIGSQAGLHRQLSQMGVPSADMKGVLSNLASTDFLQAISLLYTYELRKRKIAEGASENDLPAVRAARQNLLDIPLGEYIKYRDPVRDGFRKVAKFLYGQRIYRVFDLPYTSQVVAMAAIYTELGERADQQAVKSKLERWYWCGVFGELYGSASESRIAKDLLEVIAWIEGGPEPDTVRNGVFRPDRLHWMRTRQSAAYKGIHARLMKKGAMDFRTGQEFDTSVFFEEYVDIHHIFPEKWCKENKKDAKDFDSVINKTPLSYRTNRKIGGSAPSEYLAKLERGTDKDLPVDASSLSDYLNSHLIDPVMLRSDDFEAFIRDRKNKLLDLIEEATGHTIQRMELPAATDEYDAEPEDELS